MRFETLAAATDIYDAAEHSETSRVIVDSDVVAEFEKALKDFDRATRDYREDDYWRRLSTLLRRRRFAINSTPLPFADPQLDILGTVAVVREHLANCSALYPELEAKAAAPCDALMSVLLSAEDPLSDAIIAEASKLEGERVGVVIASFGFDRPAQHHLRARLGTDDIDVVTPRDLAARRPYDTLFVVGSPYWYTRKGWDLGIYRPACRPASPRGIPRQRFRDHAFSPILRQFTGGRQVVCAAASLPGRQLVLEGSSHEDDVEFDWDFMPREIARRATEARPGDLIDARLYLLADGFATFLQSSDDARVQVIDPDLALGKRIDSVPPADLTPGSFVLLRLEGGGDLIVVVADAILGNRALPLRELQSTWKARLKDRVAAQGFPAVVAQLKARGSPRANRANLGNWCSPRSLRTEDPADFAAILTAIGLGEEVEKYWHAMGELDSAHRKAGFEIRDQLEEQAERADLSVLETVGRLDFTLPQGGGALTAFRVEEVSPHDVRVHYQELGEPFEARV